MVGVSVTKILKEVTMSKQTAIDLLVIILNKDGFAPVLTNEEIQIAKKTEKEQHEETWFSSRVEDMGDDFKVEQKSFEDYYNETYGQTKN
jgi:hypothetical protein